MDGEAAAIYRVNPGSVRARGSVEEDVDPVRDNGADFGGVCGNCWVLGKGQGKGTGREKREGEGLEAELKLAFISQKFVEAELILAFISHNFLVTPFGASHPE